jgi:hypothetical protein
MADNFEFLMSLHIEAANARAQLRQVVEDFAKTAGKKPIKVELEADKKTLEAMAQRVETAVGTAATGAIDKGKGKKAGAALGTGLTEGLKKAETDISKLISGAMKDAMKDIGKVLAAEIRAGLKDGVSKGVPRTSRKQSSLQPIAVRAERAARFATKRLEGNVIPPSKPFLQGAMDRQELAQKRRASIERDAVSSGFLAKARFNAATNATATAASRRQEVARAIAQKAERRTFLGSMSKESQMRANEKARVKRIQESRDIEEREATGKTAKQQNREQTRRKRIQEGRDLEKYIADNAKEVAQRKEAQKAARRTESELSLEELAAVAPRGASRVVSSLRQSARAESAGANLPAYMKGIGLNAESDTVGRILAANQLPGPLNPNDTKESAKRAKIVKDIAQDARDVEIAIRNRLLQLDKDILDLNIQLSNPRIQGKRQLGADRFAKEQERAILAGVASNVSRNAINPAISAETALLRSQQADNTIGPARDEIRRQEFYRRAEVVAAQGGLFGGLNGGFSQNPDVPSFNETTKKEFQQFLEAQRRLRSAQSSVAKNRGLDFEAEAAEELDRAQKNLLKRQDSLRQQLLSREGKISIPDIQIEGNKFRLGSNVTVPVSAADSQIETAMRSRFGAAYADKNRDIITSGGIPKESLRDFVSSLLGTGANAPSPAVKASVLQSAGVDPAKFIDNGVVNATKLNRLFEAMVGSSRKLIAPWTEIGGKLDRNVKAAEQLVIKTQRMQTAALSLNKAYRDGLALFGGFAVGYTATQGLRNNANKFLANEQAQADISSVFQSRGSGQLLAEGSQQVAVRYGADLLETANSAKALAQAGFNAQEAIKELETTMVANRGIGMSIDQVQELQIAIRAVTSDLDRYGSRNIDWTRSTLDRISTVERLYAVTGQDLANALKLTLPVADNFAKGMLGAGNAIDYVNGLSTVMIERLRITGNQAGNIQKIFFSRLTQPKVLRNLQERFGAELGNAEGTDFLPLDQLITSLGDRYAELQRTNPFKAKQFATELSGGRNVTAITSVLENYHKVAKIAAESAESFGGAEARAAIATDTLNNTVQKVRTSFDLMFNKMATGTGIAKGLRGVLSGVTDMFIYLSKGSTAAVAGFAAMTVGVIGLGKAIKALALGNLVGKDFLSVTGLYAKVAGEAAGKTGRLGSVLGLVARAAGPLSLILSTVGVGLAAYGQWLEAAAKKTLFLNDAFKKLTIPDLSNIPQAQQLQESLDNAGGKVKSDVFAESLVGAFRDPRINDTLFEFVAKVKGAMLDGANTSSKAKFQMAKDLVSFFETEEFAKIGGESMKPLQRALKDVQKEGGTVGEKVAVGLAFAAQASIVAGRIITAQINSMTVAVDQMALRAQEAFDTLQEKERSRGFFAKLFSDSGKLPDFSAKVTTGSSGFSSFGVSGGLRAQTPNEFLGDDLINSITGLSEVISDSRVQGVLRNQIGAFQRARQARGLDTGTRAQLSLFLSRKGGPLYEILKVAFKESTAKLAAQASSPSGLATGGDNLTPLQQQALNRQQQGALTEELKGQGTSAIQNASEENKVLTAVADIFRFFSGGLQPSTILPNTDDGRGGRGREVIDKFESSLLDFVQNLSESIRKVQFDETFALRTRTGFDREQAQFDLAKSALSSFASVDGAVGAFELKSLFEIVRKIKENDAAANVLGTLPRNQQSNIRRLELSEQRKDLVASLQQFRSGDLSSLFTSKNPKDQKDVQALRAGLEDLFKDSDLGDIDLSQSGALQKIIEALYKIVNTRADSIAGRISQTEGLRRARDFQAAQREIGERLLPTSTNAAQRGAYRIGTIASDAEQQKIALLFARNQASLQKSNDEVRKIDEQIKNLALDTNQAIFVEAKRTLASVTEQLNQQIRANVSNTLSGVQSLVRDRNVLEQIFFPEGDTVEQRAEAKARALGQAFSTVLLPITDTLFNRIVDNFYDNLTDAITDNPAFQELFGLSESRLQLEQQQAGALLLQEGVVQGSRLGGEILAASIVAAFTGGGGSAATGAAGAIGKGLGTNAPVPSKASSRKNQLLTGLAVQAGAIGGGLLGGGGRAANAGANLGSAGGSLLFAKLGLLGGGPAGGIVGGLLGGLFGKLFDRREERTTSPTISALEAIERAQKETVTTIQAQTDALLRPEARLLNLPSTFAIPQYRPNDAGSSGPNVTTLQFGDINIDASGMTPQAARDMVAGALNDVLADQRNRGARTRRLTSA